MLNKLGLFFNQSIEAHANKPIYSNNLEAYRGLCALLVMLNHGATHENILLNDFTWPIFIKYLNSGYLSVLCFFCISGYAIGSSNYTRPLNIRKYLKKRIIRLYPIYIIAIILCLFIAQVSWLQLAQNLLFLQNTKPYFNYNIPIFVNSATWSLNYEMLYYLAFILIALFRPKIWLMLLLMAILSISLLYTNQGTEFIANYNNGFYFWLLGLLFGWNLMGTKLPGQNTYSLVSILFLHLCINYLGIGMMILNYLGVKSNTNFNWLFDLPFCLMLMSTLLSYENLFFKVNRFICYLLPLAVFIYLGLNNRLFENERWIMCLIFWAMSLISHRERAISKLMLPKLVLVGQISYGIYLFHLPIALLIKKYIFIPNQNFEIVVKYSLWATLTLFISFVAEKLIQPKIKNYFSKNARPATTLL